MSVTARCRLAVLPFAIALLGAQTPTPTPAPTPAPAAAKPDAELHAAVDAFLDDRFATTPPTAVQQLLASKHLGLADVEACLRAGRAHCPEPPQPRGKLTTGLPLPCDHFDHATEYMLYVPTGYDPAQATPVLLVAHGGSAARDLAFGARAARGGFEPFWRQEAERRRWLLVAPLTDRGWMAFGDSILFSALSRVQRDYHVDPDRIYLTGHSMGGHMTWRSAFQFADRFAAVSPMSGGYDYVQSKDVLNLLNVPGYSTFGTDEPYRINEFNHIIARWLQEHRYPWICQEKQGGHTIFPDEVPKVAAFFAEHVRDLRRPHVYARLGAQPWQFDTPEQNDAWGKKHTWRADRPLPASTVHWVRGFPPAADVPADKRVATIDARLRADNRIELVAANARKVRLYLHPAMVDFGKPVVVTANGKTVFDGRVAPDLATMLGLVREYDDRGRVFWAAIDVAITDDGAVPEPSGPQ